MNNSSSLVTKKAESLYKIIKAIGPFIISQSTKASEAVAKHQLRLTNVETARQFMASEAQAISETRAKLRDRYFWAGEEERVRLKRDIQECEEEFRRLNVIYSSLDYLTPEQNESDTKELNTESAEVSPHWLDKFNEFAKARNEPWRKDLLARALAIEATDPGGIGPRALWVIGTIDEYFFLGFSSLLDIASEIGGGYIIPNHQKFNMRPIPGCSLGSDFAIGHITFMLSDLGLLGDITSQKKISKNTMVLAKYGHRSTSIEAREELNITGIIPSKLGSTIARLYEPTPNLLGQEIYEKWCNGLSGAEAKTWTLA